MLYRTVAQVACCGTVQDFLLVDQAFYEPLKSGSGGRVEVREGKLKSKVKILFKMNHYFLQGGKGPV